MENPHLIYEGPDAPWLSKPRAPLFLLHDGGGTTFSYHLLDPLGGSVLGRPLWGVQNARLDAGGHWEGGLPQMAAHYVGLLAAALPRGGDVLLGGWSLGGLLALEMAWQLASADADADPEENRRRRRRKSSLTAVEGEGEGEGGGGGGRARPRFNVLGLLWIDSVCPPAAARAAAGGLLGNAGPRGGPLPEKPIALPAEELRAMKLIDKVNLNMTHARMMVGRWTLPPWNGAPPADAPPPTVLLRAKELVVPEPRPQPEPEPKPTEGQKWAAAADEDESRQGRDAADGSSDSANAADQPNEQGPAKEAAGGTSFVDYSREYRMLGWEEYSAQHGGFIKEVVDIEGHHFSIFQDKYINDITDKIAAAADVLDPPEF
ncbi:Alpha/Beta hydrolase protein [Xylariaceae sp. FL0804]|nr:Alpha/Beta hydrolase protein [Xylariaceae sp. FL0804]